jgi:hypothetical protein
MTISRLTKVSLRELWKHEAHGFTQWLSENLDLLGETLDFEITLVEREAAAGPFSADILAEDQDGNYVVIENQLEQTNHDHLGKLITYLSNLDAKTAIWVTSDPRPEHERAIHWLNETLPADTAFYLVKVEAYQIENSDPAPLFSIVAGPTPESKQVGMQKKDLAERHVLRLEFWKQLLEQAKTETPSFANRSPSKDNWISTSAGKSGFSYSYVIRMDDAQVDLYIDRGDGETNKRLFEMLYARKDQIEEAFGKPLDWQKLEEKRGCRIRYVIEGSGLQEKDRWADLQGRMIEALVKLQKALQPEISKVS